MTREDFDLYCAQSAETFHEGAVLALDGIDGFFDQYFHAMPVGQVIRFVVLIGGPSGVAHSVEELHAMPFVTARVDRSDEVSGDVTVLSRTSLGDWCRTLRLETQSVGELQAQFPDAPIRKVVDQASRSGLGYWRSGDKYWTSITDASAVAAVREAAGVQVIVLKTHGEPGIVARVST